MALPGTFEYYRDYINSLTNKELEGIALKYGKGKTKEQVYAFVGDKLEYAVQSVRQSLGCRREGDFQEFIKTLPPDVVTIIVLWIKAVLEPGINGEEMPLRRAWGHFCPDGVVAVVDVCDLFRYAAENEVTLFRGGK